MLETLIGESHDEIVARVSAGSGAQASSISLILHALLESLRQPGVPPLSLQQIGVQQATAAQRVGLPISHIVGSYVDICRAVTDIAFERGVTIGAADFGTFRRCLHAGIASGVMEYQRQRDEAHSQRALAEASRIAHGLRDQLTPALLAFSALRTGLSFDGISTQGVLERCLIRLRAQVGRLLSDVRARSHTSVGALPAGARPSVTKALTAGTLAECRQG